MNRASKLSQLPVTISVGANDLLYLVQNSSGNSFAVTANTLLSSNAGLPIWVTSNAQEISVASSGTSNVAWFTFDFTIFSGLVIKVNITTPNETPIYRQAAELVVTANSSAANLQSLQATVSNADSVVLSANVSANICTLFFSRANTTANANVLFKTLTTYFLAP